ncbi:MAG: right-handed parallel beta-helix repeat-containing protein [Phycisphaerales bacterium JB043]
MRFLTILACSFSLSSALAGPLTPPGAPAPTHKTLTEVEPRIAINATNTPSGPFGTYTISSPGSYYLNGNVAGELGKAGIYIDTTGQVTIDLNGFELVGIPNSGAGINVADASSVRIHNGTVRDWHLIGIFTIVGVSATLESVNATNNGGDGIFVGNHSIISYCTASLNGDDGIRSGISSVISNSTSHNNTSSGIRSSTNSTITNCSTYANTLNGISSGEGSTITGCSSYTNGTNGIFSGTGSHISGNSSRQNDGDGFNIVGGSYIFNNNASANDGDGIETAGDSYVLNNNCDSNDLDTIGDGAGIHITGDDTRVEGNNTNDNRIGIVTTSAGCLVVRNSASGNVLFNYNLHAGTRYGSIIVLGNGDIAGNANPNNNHPMANFSY